MKILSFIFFLLVGFVSSSFGANWVQTKTWNLQVGQPFSPGWEYKFEVSSNDEFLAVDISDEITIFNLHTNSLAKVIKAPRGERFTELTFNPAPKKATELVIIRSIIPDDIDDNPKEFIDYYDARNLNRIWSKHVKDQNVSSFEFSPQGDWMISGGAYTFPIFSTTTGAFLREILTYARSPYNYFSPSVSPDGSKIVTWSRLSEDGDEFGIRVIDAKSGKELNQLPTERRGGLFFLKNGGIIHLDSGDSAGFIISYYADADLKQVEEISLPEDIGKMGPSTSKTDLSSQRLQGDTYFASLFRWHSRNVYTASIYDLVSKQITHLMEFPPLKESQEIFLTANAGGKNIYVVTFQSGKKDFQVHRFESR